MRDADFKRIMKNFKNTDPLLNRYIYTQAKRYELLDDLILDLNDMINEEKRKQKRFLS